jgi:hypothetical protein
VIFAAGFGGILQMPLINRFW